MGAFILGNPWRPRADSPITPATPVSLPTLAVSGNPTNAPVDGEKVTLFPQVGKGYGAVAYVKVLNYKEKDNPLVTVSATIFGMLPQHRYTFQFCARGTECFGRGEMISVITDDAGGANITRTLAVANNVETPVDGIGLLDAEYLNNADTVKCTPTHLCVYGAYKIPTPTSVIVTPIATKAPVLPDLVLQNITRDAKNYVLMYCNNGAGTSSAKFTLEMKLLNRPVNMTGTDWERISDLTVPAPGQCGTATIPVCRFPKLDGTCADNVTVRGTIDFYKTVNESNENNNTLDRYFGAIAPSAKPTPVIVRPSPTVVRLPSISQYTVSGVVYAAGTPVKLGYPTMTVEIDGVKVYSTTVTGGNISRRAFNLYPFRVVVKKKPAIVRVNFTNDAYAPPQDRNLYVDKIVINNVTYQSENPTVYSVGVHTPSTGCAGGYKRSEMLACNGYFQYAISNVINSK